jgi:linoleoyl-CoA desaturase
LKTVRERVNAVLPPDLQKGAPCLQRKSALIAVWFLGSFILLLCAESVWGQIALCFSYGLAASAVGFNIFHDANHGAISSSRRTNIVVAILTSVALGPSRYLWKYKHNVLHHRFTNMQDWDDDLETRGFLRLSPYQPWKPRYRGQHIFVFALYAINAIEMVFVKDFVQYFTLRMNPSQNIPAMCGMEKFEFWAAKTSYVAIFIALPAVLLPFGHVVAGFLIYQVTLGLSLALIFSMAHQVERAEFPAPGLPAVSEEWAAHQMRTTVNFANSSPVLNWFSGGLNHQIEHHLFPSVSHTHYAAIGPIVRSTALEFQLPYNHFDTYTKALKSHYRFLRKLSGRLA